MPVSAKAAAVRPKTPDLIIEVAETLWGARGLDAVSLREISVAAGLSNPASVQYHFGGRESLIWAIFTRRLPGIDARRAALLDQCGERGRLNDMRALLDCLFRPLLEQRNAAGHRSYAAFLRQVLRHDRAADLRERAMSMTPATDRLLQHIAAAGPGLPTALQAHRLVAVNLLMLDVIGQLQEEPPAGLSPDMLYDDAIGMAAGALAVRPPPVIVD